MLRKFGVATGQAAYPTPLGNYEIVTSRRTPGGTRPTPTGPQDAEPIPPGPGNPLGTRWMGLSAPAVGIHGTPDAASIGYSASHGCIRMLVPEAEWLFERASTRARRSTSSTRSVRWEGIAARLEGRLVVVEPLTPEHEDDLWEAAQDPAVWRWLPGPRRRRPRELPRAGSRTRSRDATPAIDVAVRRRRPREAAKAIGSTRYLTLRPEHRGLEIGWTWNASSAWGTGANAEAKLLLLAHAFDDARLHARRVQDRRA